MNQAGRLWMESMNGKLIKVDWSLAKQCNYNLNAFATLAGISLRTLQRHCKVKHGSTPRQLIHHLKQMEVIRLAGEGLHGKEILEAVGFSHCSSLSRFLSKNGATLRALREPASLSPVPVTR